MTKTWDDIRAFRYSTMDPPLNWPLRVRHSQEGLALLGIDPSTNQLFWDGKEIVLRDHIRLSWWTRFVATLAACGMFGTFLVQASQAGWWMHLWQRWMAVWT
jgi:hypothetical protein